MAPCASDASLRDFETVATSRTKLPDDYLKFDCRESQLYSVQFYVDQLQYAHESGSILSRLEVNALGHTLESAILGAIQTFLVDKPAKP